MQKEFEKIFFVFEIIACEKVAIICLYKKKILVIGSQWVKEQS